MNIDIKGRILVVTDEAEARAALIERLRKEGHSVDGAAGGARALAKLAELAPDLVVLDVDLDPERPGTDGRALLEKILEDDPGVAVVAMTPFGAVDAGVAALEAGAGHYVTRPVNGVELALIVKHALAQRRWRAEANQLRARLTERYRFENIVGHAAPMQAVFKTVAQAASSRASVLLTGEPGTGKATIAAAIHEKSPRARGPFVRLPCAGLAESTLESELFGHEPGAAAGGAARREGRLAQAEGGTLFLDEIAELPAALQVKLRRFLESGRFERAGGEHPITADVRVIAASGRDLPQMVADGKLREDLFQRLDAVHIEIPALRDRPSDVPLLAVHFLQTFAKERGRTIAGFTDEAIERLSKYRWPGNVRELEGIIERAVEQCRGPRITGAELPPTLQSATEGAPIQIPGSTLDALERYAITRTLEATGGSTSRAAEILGISIRKVQYKLQEYQGSSPRPERPPVVTSGKRN